MKKVVVIAVFTIFVTTAAALCWADETKDHVCFRALDSDKDGIVTWNEFNKVYENEKEKFDKADVDKDGKLTHNEYHDMLGHGAS